MKEDANFPIHSAAKARHYPLILDLFRKTDLFHKTFMSFEFVLY